MNHEPTRFAWNGTASVPTKSSDRSGTAVSACFQCHKCSTGCPIGPDMDLLPSQVMRLVHLGAEAEVLESQAIWLCASCEACTTRCPMGIDIAAVMDALRMLAVERKVAVADSHGKQFNRSFLGSVRHHGRVFEVGMMAAYKLRTRRPVFRRRQGAADARQGQALAAAPSQRAARSRCARSFGGPKRRKENREIRLLSRLQSGIHRVGLRPLHAGGLRRAGHRTGRNPRLGLLRLDAGPRQQRLAGIALPVFNLQQARELRSPVLTACASCYARLRTANYKVRNDPKRAASGPSGSPASPTTAAWTSTTCSTCWSIIWACERSARRCAGRWPGCAWPATTAAC